MDCSHWCKPGASQKSYIYSYKWSHSDFSAVYSTRCHGVIVYLCAKTKTLPVTNDGVQSNIVQRVVFNCANSSSFRDSEGFRLCIHCHCTSSFYICLRLFSCNLFIHSFLAETFKLTVYWHSVWDFCCSATRFTWFLFWKSIFLTFRKSPD